MTSVTEKSRLAIIPARGGSKRIPRKNIRQFDDRPILAHPVCAALDSTVFDEVMVSSDDDEILAIAKKYGASTPFKRSAVNASDTATTADVILEVLKEYQTRGQHFSEVCCIYPTAVFVTGAVLQDSLAAWDESGADACLSVLPFTYPIQRALRMKQGRVGFMFPENECVRSQDLDSSWHDAGQFYWMNVPAFERESKIFMARTAAFSLSPMLAHDIDTLEDWDIAEFKFQYLRKIGYFSKKTRQSMNYKPSDANY